MSRYDYSITRYCYCLDARRKAREITRLYEEKLRRHDLRATQFTILAALSQLGPIALTDLAERLGLERTTLTRSADLLEERGLIASQSIADGRARPLELTAAGWEKLEAAFPDWKAVQDNLHCQF